MGWNVLAVGETGDSRRLEVSSTCLVVVIVADDEDDSASNA